MGLGFFRWGVIAGNVGDLSAGAKWNLGLGERIICTLGTRTKDVR